MERPDSSEGMSAIFCALALKHNRIKQKKENIIFVVEENDIYNAMFRANIRPHFTKTFSKKHAG